MAWRWRVGVSAPIRAFKAACHRPVERARQASRPLIQHGTAKSCAWASSAQVSRRGGKWAAATRGVACATRRWRAMASTPVALMSEQARHQATMRMASLASCLMLTRLSITTGVEVPFFGEISPARPLAARWPSVVALRVRPAARDPRLIIDSLPRVHGVSR